MSKKLIVPYVSEESNVFKKIRRPKLTLSIFSKNFRCWVNIENVLADTGADISVLPESLGILLVGNYKKGKRYKISGLLPDNVTSMYIHQLSVRLGNRTFRTHFGISNSNDVPPTLGRISGLDKLDIRYNKGKKLIINFD